MGLDLSVGILAELRELDEPEGVEHYKQIFERVNRFLSDKRIRPHEEPEHLPKELRWEGSLSYSAIHELRRVAVHLLYGEPCPAPSESRASEDPLVSAYYAEKKHAKPTPEEMQSHLHPTPWGFKHLLLHSDCEGLYLPKAARFVLFAKKEYRIPGGGMIGSSYRLAEECAALAKAMQLDINSALDQLDELAEVQPNPAEPMPWKRLPKASLTCLTLLRGAVYSIRAKAALVFR